MASTVWSAAWRIGLVIGLGWIVPDRMIACCGGFLVVAYAVVLLCTPASRALGAVTLVAFVAVCVLQALSNHVADQRLASLRLELAAYRDRTGDYPIETEDDLERIGLDTSMGLPGTRRRARYFYRVERDADGAAYAPILFYAYAYPFGRHCIDVRTGRRFSLD